MRTLWCRYEGIPQRCAINDSTQRHEFQEMGRKADKIDVDSLAQKVDHLDETLKSKADRVHTQALIARKADNETVLMEVRTTPLRLCSPDQHHLQLKRLPSQADVYDLMNKRVMLDEFEKAIAGLHDCKVSKEDFYLALEDQRQRLSVFQKEDERARNRVTIAKQMNMYQSSASQLPRPIPQSKPSKLRLNLPPLGDRNHLAKSQTLPQKGAPAEHQGGQSLLIQTSHRLKQIRGEQVKPETLARSPDGKGEFSYVLKIEGKENASRWPAEIADPE